MSHTVVIGADAAGLTAAYELSRNRYPVTVIEASEQVGGLFRAKDFEGYQIALVALGRYGFQTNIAEVQSLWELFSGQQKACKTVGNEKIQTGIYFRDRLFNYPFSLTNALKHIGPIDLLLSILSYCDRPLAQSTTYSDFETSETWLKKRFGVHLYNIFFASYFHKLWGRAASCLHSDCAIEMILDFSGGLALAEQQETQVKLNQSPKKLVHDGQRICQTVPAQGGAVPFSASDCVLSNLPLPTLVRKLEPPAPENILAAADCLQYRSLMVVALVLNHNEMFAEHEIHIHSPAVRVSRIQNFKNWSQASVADCQKTCLELTYWCDEGDALWTMADQALVQLAFRELVSLRLIPDAVAEEMVEGNLENWRLLERGQVVRHAKVQPIRSANYYRHKAVVQEYLERFENLTVVGLKGVEASAAQDMRTYSGLVAARDVMRRRSRLSAQAVLTTGVSANVKTTRKQIEECLLAGGELGAD